MVITVDLVNIIVMTVSIVVTVIGIIIAIKFSKNDYHICSCRIVLFSMTSHVTAIAAMQRYI